MRGQILRSAENKETLMLQNVPLRLASLIRSRLAKAFTVSTALLFAVLRFTPVLLSFQNPSAGIQDQGIFVLQIAGQQIGTENFEIHSRGGQVEARAEIRIHAAQDGKPFDFRTFPDLILNAELEPVAYTWSQKGSRSSSISINFTESPVRVHYRTVNGRQDDRTFTLPRGIVILDDNVINQYELVARKYLRTPGGKQTFQAFTPQEALPGTITVGSAGSEGVDFNGRKQTCQHLVLSTSLAQIDLWVDQRGRLLRMERASAQLVAVRVH